MRFLKACSDPAAQFKVYRLWKLLDDIDTASDVAKSNNDLFRALVEQYQRQRFDVVDDDEIDTLYDKYDVAPPLHTEAEADMSRQNDPYYQAVRVVMGRMKQAGWWAIDPDNLKMVLPAESDYVTGDGPADALDAALDRITDEYQQAWGRQPTVTELDAAWRFVTGPARAGLSRRMAAAKGKYKGKKEITNAEGKKVTVYQYSERQIANRHREKSERLDKLQTNIGDLETKLKQDLKSDDPETQLTALAVALINHTYERVGNEGSAADGHFGVTGWLKKHVSFNGSKAKLSYVGKSGVKQNKAVTDPDLVAALKDLCEGKSDDDPLFDCDDCTVTSKEVNAYLKPFDVTAKDLRGYHANREMMERLGDIRADGPELPRGRKERDEILKAEFKKALEATAEVVGHEASTLRSQYLVPHLEETYMKDGSVIDSLRKKKASLRTASDALARFVQATKTRAEREDEQVKDKLVRRSPKVKPPREDLRDHRIDTDEDPDMESQGQEGDRDLSMNYKRVAAQWLARHLYADGAPDQKIPTKEEQAAGSIVTTEAGRLRAKNKVDNVKYFDKDKSEEAKVFSEGSETSSGADDLLREMDEIEERSQERGKDEGESDVSGEGASKQEPEHPEAPTQPPASQSPATGALAKAMDDGDTRAISKAVGALKESDPELAAEVDKHMASYQEANKALNKATIALEMASSAQEKKDLKAQQEKALADRDAAVENIKKIGTQPEAAPEPAAPEAAPEPVGPSPEEIEKAKTERFNAALNDLGMSNDSYSEMTKDLNIPEDQSAEFAQTLATKFKGMRDNPQVNDVALQMRGPVDPKADPAAQAEQLAINHYTDEYILNPARIAGGFAKKGPLPEKELKDYSNKVYSELSKMTPAEVNVVLDKAQKVLADADPEKEDTPAMQQARKMMTAGYLAFLKGGGDPDDPNLPAAAKQAKDVFPANVAKLAEKMGDRAAELANLVDGDLLDGQITGAIRDTYKNMSADDMIELHAKTNPHLAEAYAFLSFLPESERAARKAELDELASTIETSIAMGARSAASEAKNKPKTRKQRQDSPATTEEVDSYVSDMVKELMPSPDSPSMKKFLESVQRGESPPNPAAEVFPKAADRLELLRKQLVEGGLYPKSENVRRLDETIKVLRAGHEAGDYNVFESLRRVGEPPPPERPRKVSDVAVEDPDANVEIEGRRPGEVWETNRGADLTKQYGALSKDGETYDYFDTKEDAQSWIKST